MLKKSALLFVCFLHCAHAQQAYTVFELQQREMHRCVYAEKRRTNTLSKMLNDPAKYDVPDEHIPYILGELSIQTIDQEKKEHAVRLYRQHWGHDNGQSLGATLSSIGLNVLVAITGIFSRDG